MTAAASRASSLRSHWAWLPRPIGQPVTIVSTTPPSVSPASRAASIAATIAASASGVERVDRAGVANRQVKRLRRGADAPELADIAEDRDSELAQQQLGEGPDGDPQRGLAALARSSTWRMPV